LIAPERGKLIRDGLIKKKRNTNTSDKKDNGARLA
jgi:gas vesicle protein